MTGEDPAFVLVDSQERLIVFLDYPADPEAQPVPVWFAVRALNSLVVRSLVVTAIKNPFTLVARGFWHLGSSGAAALDSAPGNPAGPPPPLDHGAADGPGRMGKAPGSIVGARRYKGRVDLFIDGEKFFPALIESVLHASPQRGCAWCSF